MKNYILIFLIAYFLGNFSSAFIFGKLIMKKDVRDYGSGNSGATNALRAFGLKVGIISFIGDILKGAIAVYIGRLINPEFGPYIAGLAVVIGHNWPVVLKFKGGKGVASTLGVMIMVSPTVSLVCFAIGISIAFLTRTVSLGSIIGLILAPLVVLIIIKPFNAGLLIFTIILAVMSIYRHRSNIKRLLKGEENKL